MSRKSGRVPGDAPYGKRGFVELLAGSFYLDLGGDHRDSVLVAGSGRSGTTWLSVMLSRRTDSRFIFEPFPRKRYLRPDDQNPKTLDEARRVFCGRVSGTWPDRFNRRFIARRRVIKDIRANLMLAWIHDNFPEMPIVFMIRNPLAGAMSRRNLGWNSRLPDLLSQRELLEDHLEPFEERIRAAHDSGDALERHIHLWCAENFVPLQQMQTGLLDAHVVFYEDLVADTEAEMQNILSYIRSRPKKPAKNPLPRLSIAPEVVGSAMGRDSIRAEEIVASYGLEYLYGNCEGVGAE